MSVIGNYTKTTDGDQTFSTVFNSGSQMFNFDSGNVYVTFQLTFSNPTNPGVLDTSQSYGGYSHSGSDLFGQNWQQSKVGVVYYGQRDDVAGQTITPGSAITMVVKYELNGLGLDGDTVKFWVNPTLGSGTEPLPNDASPGWLWNPTTISSDNMMFRRGNSSENVLAFENIKVYSGGDSPFAVPETSTLLLGLMSGGLLFVRKRRP